MTDDLKHGYQFHHIQKNIILSLVSESPLRFKDLQPPRIPNNTFSYHLKKLVDSGYVEKGPKGYKPTRKALKLVAYSSSYHKAKSSPKTISIIYVINQDGEVLLINRNNQPFQGWYGLPSGPIHLGETLQVAAKRELLEKTLIEARDDLTPCGVIEFKYVEQGSGDIFVHAIGFIYKYEYKGSSDLLNDVTTKYGQLTWSKFGRKLILPEAHEVDKIVKEGVFKHQSIVFEEPENLPVFTDDNDVEKAVGSVNNETITFRQIPQES